MTIKFQCKEDDFRQVEVFLCEQEYFSHPGFDEVELSVKMHDNSIETIAYKTVQEFGKWYLAV